MSVEAQMRIAVLFVCLLPTLAGCSTPVRRSTPANAAILDVGDLNTEQIRALDRAHTVVLLEGGILEEHGPYLPSFSDGYQSAFIAAKVADAVAGRSGWTVLRFPPLPLGAMPANEIGGRFTFPGSYPVRMATLRAVYMDLATDLGEAAFKYILIVNYHGGPSHNEALDDASRYFGDKYSGVMVNLMGLANVAGAAPHDQFTKSEREAEGFSVHADADEHSRMMYLKPDVVGKRVHQAQAIVGHEPADLVALAQKPDWPGYFGTPAIAGVEAGRRKMDGLAAAAVEAALEAIDGTLPAAASRVVDESAADPAFSRVTRASLEHDRQVEKTEMDWLLSGSRTAPQGPR
jgi:creatinine amidohydrolase/Fe(II)-dependent formamide hydrolase-like protein